jgi:hypothetical protein
MVANVSFNPVLQTNAAGMFTIESDGFIVGQAMPDPATRFALAGGYLGPLETLPMFGGVAIEELISTERSTAPATPTRPDYSLGGTILRAVDETHLTGFSVFDQNYAAVSTPQGPVPVSGNGMLVNFYRLGSGARIALAIDPTLVTLEGGIITPQVSWDYTNQLIVAFATAALPIKILQIKSHGCMVPVYNPATNYTTWNYNGAAALVQI